MPNSFNINKDGETFCQTEETEVVRVLPFYNSISNEEKRSVLNLMEKWVSSELAKLPEPPKEEE